MKAIAYQKFGNSNVLQTVEQPKPTINSNQVLVKVKAFSINPMDWKIRKGEMKLMSGSKFPKNTAADFAGIVTEAGSSVNGFKIGDEVFGVVKDMMKEGASAEYVAVPASLIWKKPSTVNFFQAASIPVVGTAALTALQKMGKIDSGTTILVNGATGGFGMFLLQLLKQRGAKVTAVTSNKGVEFAKKWGADTVIDYSKENVLLSKLTYDIVIDLSGKMGYKSARQIMKPKSIFLNPTPKPIEIPGSILKNLFTGKKHIVLLSSPSLKHTNVLLNAVMGGLDIEVNKVFPFTQYKEAYQYAEKGGYIGKVVVEIN
ncbi:NAD(P)-dependent alcohol dehydrogenase [Flavobacterium sp. ENC]|uniref:NAD(P)-dependent alcohol dehydrogenase n=1 Tax=Flavobacterium sp. ENC TaxID=2897330 RepID=UPI001E57E310|nr:NAD(P)-dependent alcohol dehydrogenase [Flavobacterium sp. ENC]MCD0467002.1 NAD(P)-dependent alcohol dehydrogenase [Flavobacterium sp. ENC]